MILLLAVFGRAVFMLPFNNAVGLIVAGAINIIGAVYYYKALQIGDNTDITIFGQVSPLISLGLGAALLGELITPNQGIGFLFIMAATAVVIFGGKKSGAKKQSGPNVKVIVYTIVSCFFSVLSDIVYAMFLGDGPANYILFAQSFFYFEIGSLLAVILAVIFFDSWREALKKTFFTGRKHNLHMAFLIGDNLALTLGEILYKFGLIAAPVVSLVSPIGKVAGLFTSFFITIFLGKLFPKVIRSKRITKRIITQYMIAGVLIMVGLVIMN